MSSHIVRHWVQTAPSGDHSPSAEAVPGEGVSCGPQQLTLTAAGGERLLKGVWAAQNSVTEQGLQNSPTQEDINRIPKKQRSSLTLPVQTMQSRQEECCCEIHHILNFGGLTMIIKIRPISVLVQESQHLKTIRSFSFFFFQA